MKILSIFFDLGQTFLSLIEDRDNGVFLNYINSTSRAIDLENIEESKPEIEQLNALIAEAGEVDHVLITLPTERVLMSYIPGDIHIETNQIQQMIELEIKNSDPEAAPDDFTTILYDFSERMDGNKMMNAAIIPNDILRNIAEILAPHSLSISKINISQFATHNALTYNYPELKEKAAAIVSIQLEYIDISIIKEGKPIYLSKVYFESPKELAGILEDEFNIIMTDYIDYVETAYFCGSHLTADLLQAGETKLAEFLMTAAKVNTFKMIRTDLGQREKDYCQRTSHIFPPCIGAVLPSIGESMVYNK